jgi:hypothetical protein
VTDIIIPKRGRGRLSARGQERYDQEVATFCARILEIRATLDFQVSARGWCYILEEHGATKGDFDTIQRLFTECRKSGALRIDICAEDEARAADHIERVDDETAEEFAEGWVDYLRSVHKQYNPISLWDYSDVYIEMWVEKIDLKSLFSDICKRYTIPLINIRGRTCLNSRAGTMHRFLGREAEGKQCVLLYCGDHDPSGLAISREIRSDMESMSGATGYRPRPYTLEEEERVRNFDRHGLRPLPPGIDDGLIIDRFGLNKDFIDQQRLSWSENLETSSGGDLASPRHPDHGKDYVQRYLKKFGARKVEANALVVRPEAGRQLCLDAIRRYIPDDLLEDFKARRAAAQEDAREAIAQLLPDEDAA